MRNPVGFSILALAAAAPLAVAGGNETKLDSVRVPALKSASVDYTPGKGVTFSSGESDLTITGWFKYQYRFSAGDISPDINTFEVLNGRAAFKGHLFKKTTKYYFQLDFANATNVIKDAWVKQRLWSNEDLSIAVRAGQQKTLYGRSETGSSTKLEFPVRGVAESTFSGVRARGANVLVSLLDDRLHLNGGVWNTDTAGGNKLGAGGEDSNNNDNELNFSIGAVLDSDDEGGMSGLGYSQGDLEGEDELRWSVGGGLWIGNESIPVEVDTLGFNVNGAVKINGVHAMVDFFWRNADKDGASADATATGLTAQASYTMKNPKYTFGLRYSWVNIDDDAGVDTKISLMTAANGGSSLNAVNGDATEFTLMVGRYLNGHSNKILADVTFQTIDPDAGSSTDNVIFRVQHLVHL